MHGLFGSNVLLIIDDIPSRSFSFANYIMEDCYSYLFYLDFAFCVVADHHLTPKLEGRCRVIQILFAVEVIFEIGHYIEHASRAEHQLSVELVLVELHQRPLAYRIVNRTQAFRS